MNDNTDRFLDLIGSSEANDEWCELPKNTKRAKAAAKECAITDEYFEQFHVEWMEPRHESVNELKKVLDSTHTEHDLQRCIEDNPLLIARAMIGGHGRWVVPKIRFGSEYCSDFMMCEGSSIGLRWTAVELEPSTFPIETKSGNPSHQLTHAIKQIHDWRDWLRENRNYASRSKTESGLGMPDIDENIFGLIIIGRRSELSESSKRMRRRYFNENKIAIHTYDWLCGPVGRFEQ